MGENLKFTLKMERAGVDISQYVGIDDIPLFLETSETSVILCKLDFLSSTPKEIFNENDTPS